MAEQFNSLLNGMSFIAEISMNEYNPAQGDLNLDDKFFKVKIIARKTGSLIF